MKAKTGKKRKSVACFPIIEAEMAEGPLTAFLSLFLTGQKDGGAIVTGEIILSPMTTTKDAGDRR
jgi:hypothetical protein